MPINHQRAWLHVSRMLRRDRPPISPYKPPPPRATVKPAPTDKISLEPAPPQLDGRSSSYRRPRSARLRGSLFRSTGKFFGIAWAAMMTAHAFYTYGYTCLPSWGISMLPTINSFGDLLITNRMHRRGKNIVVGDVVSFALPIDREIRAVKRVLGMPGDFVLQHTPGASNSRMIQVPEGHCWLVGDNLAHSRDSRGYGPIPLALIIGKVVARVETGNRWIPAFHRVTNGLEKPV